MELSSYVAAIDGHQRKVVSASARPVRAAHGEKGIPLRNGRTLPFRVRRAWNAPAGDYTEAWYIVDPETREVLHEGPSRLVQIWGLLSYSEFSDDVTAPIVLPPGRYLIVFAVGGVMGGQIEVEAVEIDAEAA